MFGPRPPPGSPVVSGCLALCARISSSSAYGDKGRGKDEVGLCGVDRGVVGGHLARSFPSSGEGTFLLRCGCGRCLYLNPFIPRHVCGEDGRRVMVLARLEV